MLFLHFFATKERVALAAILTEANQDSMEHQREMKTLTICAHASLTQPLVPLSVRPFVSSLPCFPNIRRVGYNNQASGEPFASIQRCGTEEGKI